MVKNLRFRYSPLVKGAVKLLIAASSLVEQDTVRLCVASVVATMAQTVAMSYAEQFDYLVAQPKGSVNFRAACKKPSLKAQVREIVVIMSDCCLPGGGLSLSSSPGFS